MGDFFFGALGAPASLADDCHDALRKQGIDVTGAKRLGSGHFGTAYLLRDGRVLKVTSDMTEGNLAAWLLANKRALPSMFPRIDSAFLAQCSAKYGPPDIYIVREQLDSIPDADLHFFHQLTDELDRWMLYADGFEGGETVEDLEYDIQNTVGKSPIAKGIFSSLAWMKKNKIFVEDINAGNIGIRPSTGDIVIRDLGQNTAPTNIPLEPLAGLRRGRGLRLKARRL